MKSNRLAVFLALVVLATALPVIVLAEPEKTVGSESLGGKLLDDLPTGPSSLNPAAQNNSAVSTTATEPKEAGEDVGRLSEPLALARVRSGMQRAEMLLGSQPAEANGGELAKVRVEQQKVIAQLDDLIAELSQQSQGGQSKPENSQSAQSSQPSPTKPQPRATTKPGRSSPRDSHDPLNRAQANQVAEPGGREEIVKRLWGHLPERSREQVQQSFSEEFLPKYELEIEQYYRRLSEEPPTAPPAKIGED